MIFLTKFRNLASIITVIPLFPLALAGLANPEYPQPCNDDIYCYGEILHTVQMAEPFKDRKTFVDLPLKLPRPVVKENFSFMMVNTSNNPSVDDIKQFLLMNFDERGEELSAWEPQDWKPFPQFTSYIRDDTLRQYALELNALWKELGKRISTDVKDKPDMYSLVYLPNPVILPGGRFLELYYWDTYWIIRGLIHCEMHQSVKGMLQDFLLLLDTFGYVPNGNRIYYSRTQPPFLIQMFKDYVEATGDLQFLEESLPVLEKEFQFWMSNRSVVVHDRNTENNYTLFRYINEVTGPRPESYSREYVLAETLESTQQRDEFYMNMKSGAESGWDYSSRWFPINSSANSSLLATKTSNVVPVDLNSIIYKNAVTLAHFSRLLEKTGKAQVYDVVAEDVKSAINNVLWDNSSGVWFDYDLHENILRKKFYPSNIFPLWAGITSVDENITNVVAQVVNYLRNSGAMNWDGGIPTSLETSSQQWDFPNTWPPLQHLFVEALDNTDYGPAKDMAFDTAQKWVANNYLTYKRHNDTMFEKYTVYPGEPGGGGLYDVVVGFGWSNGVIIDFLEKYGDRLSPVYNDIAYLFMM